MGWGGGAGPGSPRQGRHLGILYEFVLRSPLQTSPDLAGAKNLYSCLLTHGLLAMG